MASRADFKRGSVSCLRCLAAGLVILLLAAPALSANNAAWMLLLNNKSEEAIASFGGSVKNKDPLIAKDALVGSAFASLYLGRDIDAARYFLTSCLIKPVSPAETYAGNQFMMIFSRNPEAFKVEEGFKLFQQSIKTYSLFTGNELDEFITRSIADGDIKLAKKLSAEMGSIRTWQCIGPFENTSSSGYNTAYPPETEIDYARVYSGKDGNQARWFPITVNDPRGWLFMEEHTHANNAVYYFYCTVESPADLQAKIAFGASGTFKIFLNGNLVLADSVFRNTGSDTYIQTVKLRKGNNALLIKLGHENQWHFRGIRKSNFLVRFLNMDYSLQKQLRYTVTPFPIQRLGEPGESFADLKPMPAVDSCARILKNRLSANPDDFGSLLLLVNFYNITEMTDSAQVICERYLKRFPQSSLLHQYYSESLRRAHKNTQAQAELKTAYRLSPENCHAWSGELVSIAETGNYQNLLEFITNSFPEFKNSRFSLQYQLTSYLAQENRAEAYNVLERIEKEFPYDYEAVEIAAKINQRLGYLQKAEKMVTNLLEHDHGNAQLYEMLINLKVKEGNVGTLLDITRECQRYCPDNADSYFNAAAMLYVSKQYDKALDFIEEYLKFVPASANALNLKGNLLSSLGRKDEAKNVYKEAIVMTNDNFNAWENIRLLEKKPVLDSLAPLPPADSLIAASKSWGRLSSEQGAIISLVSDVFYYPSHCSRERTSIIVYCGTQKAIDTWKEYTIGFNSYYQTAHVSKAVSRSPDGKETPADINDQTVVFKSLRPGDCIVLEYGIRNYYSGLMARQCHGNESFQLSYPVFDRRVRFIMPAKDTIPYRVYGDSLKVTTVFRDDYRITSICRAANKALEEEAFMASEWPAKQEVSYSTIADWGYVVKWYNGLTHHKVDRTLELTALADSLFANASTPAEKVRRVHDYIVSNIRYSYVPFRQSGWIPQMPQEVLASRMGDCKDMSSLARHLCNIAGLEADMVLVNTQIRHYTGHAYVGPNFNHCIVSYSVNGKRSFMDCTVEDLSFGFLPRADQGAMALIINDTNATIFTLPVDSSGDRSITRKVTSVLDSALTLTSRIQTVRSAGLAISMRSTFRFLSPEEQRKELRKSLVDDYADITIDTVAFTGLSPAADTLSYTYCFTAKKVATISGTTAMVPLHFSDKVESHQFPSDDKRSTPVDMAYSAYDIGRFSLSGQLTFPGQWKPITVPKPMVLTSPWGNYRLEFTQKGNRIQYTREAVFTMYKPIPPEQYDAFKSFMMQVAQADAAQLLFFIK